jgi:hypothetical protein
VAQRSLRRQNSEWGVRDTGDLAVLATRSNLELAAITQMPVNNLTLAFKRSAVRP